MEAFFRGFEKQAAQHEEEMEKEAIFGRAMPAIGRFAGRISKGRFRQAFGLGGRGAKQPAIKSMVKGNRTVGKETGVAAGEGARKMTLREQWHQAKGEFGRARANQSQTAWTKEGPGKEWASQERALTSKSNKAYKAKQDAAIARADAKAKAAKAEAEAAKADTPETTAKPDKPETSADQSILDKGTEKVQAGWDKTKDWWGGLQPETKKYIKGAGLVGGGLAAGHMLTRSGDNTTNYGPSYGV